MLKLLRCRTVAVLSRSLFLKLFLLSTALGAAACEDGQPAGPIQSLRCDGPCNGGDLGPTEVAPGPLQSDAGTGDEVDAGSVQEDAGQTDVATAEDTGEPQGALDAGEPKEPQDTGPAGGDGQAGGEDVGPSMADASVPPSTQDAAAPPPAPVDMAPPPAVDLAPPPPPPPATLVTLTPGSQAFTAPTAVVVTATLPGVALHCTVDGTVPTTSSPTIAGPIAVDRPMTLRVLAIEGARQEVHSAVYFPIGADVAAFSSNLPLVFLHSLNEVEPPRTHFTNTPAAMLLARPEAGVARATGPLDVASRVGWKVRGRTSRNFDQRSFAVELWGTVDGDDLDLPVLGMPKQSDWVLHGPAHIDRSLLRNALFMELTRRAGHWAPRTRFVEVFAESEGRPITFGSYRGIYTLMEKVKRDPQRVNITKLRKSDIALPALTGGYIFKVDDNFAPDEIPFVAGGLTMELADPDPDEVTAEQLGYLTDTVNDFAAALAAPGGVNPRTGQHYSALIDVDSWIDFHILNVFAKNADSLRLSAYFHKDRGGKVKAGPMWDLDRSAGADDVRVMAPEDFSATNGTDVFAAPWWADLFRDPAFEERYWKRWEELLGTLLRADVIAPIINGMVAELKAAQPRHIARWTGSQPAGGYDAEIERLHDWIVDRIAWLKANLRKR